MSIIGDVASRVEDILADEFKRRGFDPKTAPMYAQMLVGMVGTTGQWWLDARKPAKRRGRRAPGQPRLERPVRPGDRSRRLSQSLSSRSCLGDDEDPPERQHDAVLALGGRPRASRALNSASYASRSPTWSKASSVGRAPVPLTQVKTGSAPVSTWR